MTQGQIATSLLEPNLSATQGGFQSRMVPTSDDLNLLQMTLCNPRAFMGADGGAANFQLGSQWLLKRAKVQTISQIAQSDLTSPPSTYQLENLKPLTKMIYEHLLGPMQKLDETLDYYTIDYWKLNGDARASKLPFMTGGPWKLVGATIVYLYLIKVLIPELMKRFQAFELNWIIRVYNLSMVLFNIMFISYAGRIVDWGRKCFHCQMVDPDDNSPEIQELIHYGWLFLVSRVVEWLDTIFFVLRKRQRQVTKLHVFHHSYVPILSWVYLKFHPAYAMAFFPMVNSFVHTIMYTYYTLATFGPSVQPYLWWKRYLTSLQIIQFVIVLVQLLSVIFSQNETCRYAAGYLYVGFGSAVLFLWLFYTYYLDTYKSPAALKSRNQSSRRESKDEFCSQNREGSSRSLSDAINNAIVAVDDQGKGHKQD